MVASFILPYRICITTQRSALARGQPQQKIYNLALRCDRETSLVEVSAYMDITKMKKQRTIVYVDGFNLYYGALKDKAGCRWLNIEEMVKSILPSKPTPINDIVAVKYFTAKISSRANHPNQVNHQNIYLKALKTIPNLEVVLGRYDTHIVRSKLAAPIVGVGSYVDVYKTEEKGSDVNLATHLLHDAHTSAFDVAIVITNDSDLALPIEFVVSKLNKKVGVISPYPKASMHLCKVSSFTRVIRRSNITSSQFADQITDSDGTVLVKPTGW